MDSKATEFRCTSFSTDWEARELSFMYEVVLADSKIVSFTERITLPKDISLENVNKPEIHNALILLHLLLGTSYYKMHVAHTFSHPYKLSHSQADFWNKMYGIGLGEFYYVNDLLLIHRKLFSEQDGTYYDGQSIDLSERALVQHGGGKDSLVSVEVVKQTGIDFDLVTFGTSLLQESVAKKIGKETHIVQRIIDPKLFELSTLGHVYTGHVPIASMYAGISVLVALLNGNSYVVASNEKSANYGNVQFDDHTVNHQWDKSDEFEDMIQTYITENIHHSLRFFSLMRPLSELAIVMLFSKYSEYFTTFSSSNHHFVLKADKNPKRWDVKYSKGKVEFVYALFTGAVAKEIVLEIFEEDIYSRDDVLEKYKELLGTKSIKPLECVGTPDETKAAMYLAHLSGDYEETPVMQYFVNKVFPTISHPQQLVIDELTYGDDSRIPENLKKTLRSMCERVSDIMSKRFNNEN